MFQEKEHFVDALNAALAAQIVRQKQSKYISEWRCASKYWTKYITHFFWHNEQVGLCKAWARVDGKVSELLDAWRAINKLPQGLLIDCLVTDKLEVEVGSQHVDIDQIFDHIRMAHECIFEANNVEGKKCQNAKILNANEWDMQIKQFKSEAKKLSSSAEEIELENYLQFDPY